MSIERFLRSTAARLVGASVLAAAVWIGVLFLALNLFWWSSSRTGDWFFGFVFFLLPGLLCGAVAWFSRTAWSVLLAIAASVFLIGLFAVAEPPAILAIASTLPTFACWAVGYGLGRRSRARLNQPSAAF